MPEMRLAPRIARGFVYLLVVVAFTVTAAYGGYTIGKRSVPDQKVVRSDTSTAVSTAVARAVARQKALDRTKRREALRDFAVFQRAQFASEKQAALSAQQLEDAKEAARAYARGKKAGAVTAMEKLAEADAKTPGGAPKRP